jgi:plasmid stability protein
MATLTIRNLPDAVRDKLRIRAAENRRSMEAEARDLLTSAVSARPSSMATDDVAKRVKAVQDALKPYLPEGVSLVDEFLAGRRQMWGEE